MSEELKGIPEEEIERPKEPAPITGEELVAIIRSHRFMDMMDWAVSYVDNYPDAESGFTVLRDAHNPSIVECTRVHEGITYQILRHQISDLETADEMTKKGYHPIFIFDFHFHPSEPPIAPSVLDIDEGVPYGGDVRVYEHIREASGFIAPVIAMIGHRRENGVDILMFQRPIQADESEEFSLDQSMALEKDLRALDEKENEEQSEVLKVLRKHGFKAEMVRLDKDLKLFKSDEEKVKKFACQPRISRY